MVFPAAVLYARLLDPFFLHFDIANQETIMEILQFIQKVSPSSPPHASQEAKVRTNSRAEGGGGSGTGFLPAARDAWKIEAGFDFNRLSVLLLRRFVGKDGNQGARKIATATACDARVSCSAGEFLNQNSLYSNLLHRFADRMAKVKMAIRFSNQTFA